MKRANPKVPRLFLPYAQGGRGVSLGNWRIDPDQPHTIGSARERVNTTGGAVDKSRHNGPSRPRGLNATERAERAVKRASRHRNGGARHHHH